MFMWTLLLFSRYKLEDDTTGIQYEVHLSEHLSAG